MRITDAWRRYVGRPSFFGCQRERTSDSHRSEAHAIGEVFAQQQLATLQLRGCNDRRIPPPDAIALLEMASEREHAGVDRQQVSRDERLNQPPNASSR